jgi:hypothetical protein
MFRKVTSVLLSVAFIAAASPPGGTVTASGSFRLNGTEVPAAAAVSVPIGGGDEVSTTDAAAVLRFADDAVLILAPRSSLKTEAKQDRLLVHLNSGSLEFKLSSASRITILNRGKAVEGKLEGAISAKGGKALPIALASTGGAAVAAATAALVKRSQTCPDGTPKTKDCGNQD